MEGKEREVLVTANITRREAEILTLMAEGSPAKIIAAQLNISPETVKKHIKNIYQKIGAHNKIEALNKTKWLIASFNNSVPKLTAIL